jgi:hypothetical protein
VCGCVPDEIQAAPPSYPLSSNFREELVFVLEICSRNKQNESRTSLTRFLSKDETSAFQAKAAPAMTELHDRPSSDQKRAYQLQHDTLSELVSDLWWVNKNGVNKKVLKGGQ